LVNEALDTRDYFAGQAIIGMLSNPHCTLPATQRESFPAHVLQILAFHAYQIADAMIEASAIKDSGVPPEPVRPQPRPVLDPETEADAESPY
jgi:hypothetical protein